VSHRTPDLETEQGTGIDRGIANSEPIMLQGEHTHNKRRVDWEIMRAFIIIFFPLASLSAALIGIVRARRVQSMHFSSSSALDMNGDENEPGVYLVRINSTTLVLLASFCSSLAPSLVVFVMNLFSYPVSRHILHTSDIQPHINSLF
jgi:hypothetical protein